MDGLGVALFSEASTSGRVLILKSLLLSMNISTKNILFDDTSYQITNSMVRESIEKIWEEHSDFHSSRVEILSTILGWIKRSM